MPTNASLSMTSKKDLNRPLYEAVKTGVTAISPSAWVTTSIAVRKAGLGNIVTRFLAMSTARSRSSITVTSAGTTSWVAAASRSASKRVEEGTLKPAETTTMFLFIGNSPTQVGWDHRVRALAG